MCGITGIFHAEAGHASDSPLIEAMLSAIRHRGPDQFGAYCDGQVGLGSARLSIIDLAGGQQPISNEDGACWIVFNGEIFNYLELRTELLARGHRFSTHTDTETILHLYEDMGPACVSRLRGQFAFALWDRRQYRLFLARDPLGVRPLFYTRLGLDTLFASEIKALLCHPQVQARMAIDPGALAEIFTLWTPLTGHTAFRGIESLPPGHIMLLQGNEQRTSCYWRLQFPAQPPVGTTDIDGQAEQLRATLREATLLRLRADVPVGVYVSGGLDSSLIAALVARESNAPLETFSIAFTDDPIYDESRPQAEVIRLLGTRHHQVACTQADIVRIFPQVIWHVETPILRTSPAPMFLLSQRVQEAGLKVVLTGEGADEFMAGYDIFKEDKILRFWARQPGSQLRPRLLERLYPYIPGFSSAPAYLQAFFGRDLADTDLPHYSHRVRWRNGARLTRFFSSELRAALAGYDPQEVYVSRLDDDITSWPGLSRAQYIEASLFLSEYLLSSQGDRMSMAHSIEGRYPFLDPAVVAFCAQLDPRLRMRGLQDKYLLRRCAEPLLPPSIWRRAKQPYRAPIAAPLLRVDPDNEIPDLLSSSAIRQTGYFDPAAVEKLQQKYAANGRLSELDSMALAGIVSTQLLHHQFVTSPAGKIAAQPLPNGLLVERREACQ